MADKRPAPRTDVSVKVSPKTYEIAKDQTTKMPTTMKQVFEAMALAFATVPEKQQLHFYKQVAEASAA